MNEAKREIRNMVERPTLLTIRKMRCEGKLEVSTFNDTVYWVSTDIGRARADTVFLNLVNERDFDVLDQIKFNKDLNQWFTTEEIKIRLLK